MPKRFSRIWLLLLIVPAGLLLVPGLWVYMSVTAKRMHPASNAVPGTRESTAPRWEDSAHQAREAVRAGLTEQNLPGASVAVGIDGTVAWAEGFGFADLKTSELVTSKHRFRIGTVSTALTSVAAGLLVEDGRLRLDEAIQTYVPAFPRKQWRLTVRQLMGHTSGLVSDGGDEGILFSKHCEHAVEALPSFDQSPLGFQPQTQYRSSNYDWILVSAAIESAASQPLSAFLRTRVFEAAGMIDTTTDPAPPEAGEADDFPFLKLIRELVYEPESKRDTTTQSKQNAAHHQVTSYFPRFAANPTYGLHVMRPLDYSCYSGGSVFVSTPSDLVRFGMAVSGGQLLRPETVELLQASQRLTSGKETGNGLGWYRRTVTLGGKPTVVTGQDGHLLGGTVASLMTFPAHRMTIAVTANISYADTATLAMKVAEIFAGQTSDAGGR